jgi:hypothetical protein
MSLLRGRRFDPRQVRLEITRYQIPGDAPPDIGEMPGALITPS